VPEFFLELFSEEIPARMQARAAEELSRRISEVLAPLAPDDVRTFYGPRRLALVARVWAEVAASSTIERGPKTSAPEQAVAGFLRKHGAAKDALREEGGYWVLEKTSAAVSATQLIAGALPGLLRRFSWPKSMRWGGTSQFVWVRPLRRIVCLLDGEVVPFDLRDGSDDGHGLTSANLTEGHRFHAPGAFPVTGFADWQTKLLAHRVLIDAADRRRMIADGLELLAADRGLAIVEDSGLLDEVAGLVEWPVPLLGRIADEHMDLPPEVMQVSMRVNQRYFAVRTADGRAAPWFAFAANVEADDGGSTIVAGNERVLRARFSDARHFWDLDRKARLENLVPQLDQVTFHARLGSQGDRVRRLKELASLIATELDAGRALAERAAELAKADLLTGMVGEFPELQGVMGRYYALHDGEDPLVADAIADHYAPKGPTDAVPTAAVSIAVALADKVDQLVGFFLIGEKPTGGGDPYALRRAALGLIRIIRENRLRLSLLPILEFSAAAYRRSLPAQKATEDDGPKAIPGSDRTADPVSLDVVSFIHERLRVALRTEGERYDVLNAVFAVHWDDDLTRLLARANAVSALLASPDGADLLTAYRRAANILRIEERKDGPFDQPPIAGLFREQAEIALDNALAVGAQVENLLRQEDFVGAMGLMATLRPPLDAFFTHVTVNASEPELRLNRLHLLNRVRSTMDRVADFSRIEG
jgi:glycyl-tRNA synthetase beta chain